MSMSHRVDLRSFFKDSLLGFACLLFSGRVNDDRNSFGCRCPNHFECLGTFANRSERLTISSGYVPESALEFLNCFCDTRNLMSFVLPFFAESACFEFADDTRYNLDRTFAGCHLGLHNHSSQIIGQVLGDTRMSKMRSTNSTDFPKDVTVSSSQAQLPLC